MSKRVSWPIAILILGLAVSVQAAGPSASPMDSTPIALNEAAPPATGKALGDPTDWLSSALAGADYVVSMQSDVTEDNAGNGDPDDDAQDGGWDWSTTAFEHSSSASSGNLYGVTANGILQAWLIEPTLQRFTAMKDAADMMVSRGPEEVRSASDIIFLLDFAAKTGVASPSTYVDGALAIWTRQETTYGSGTALAEYIRDARYGQGYSNGIIPWDIGLWARAMVMLDAVLPGNGYDTEAVAIAEVLWQDSFNATPGYFDPNGANKGYTLDYSNTDYYWYSLGVWGLIEAFAVTGAHTAEIPALAVLMDECQYDDGAFGYQYGAPADVNDRDWQATAYCVWGLYQNIPHTPASLTSLREGATWLASTQDVVSGGWVYGSGNHYPEIGGECTAGVAYGWLTAHASIAATVDGPDPVSCGEAKNVTFAYAPEAGTPGLRGYEVTFQVSSTATFVIGDIADAGGLGAVGLHAFYKVDNGDGTFTVTDALLGATAGLTAPANLFTVALTTASDGVCDVEVLSYKLRDPDNGDIFGEVTGASFLVDCTAPPAVTDIAAAPGHEKVDVSWTMADETDVDHYAVFRAVWHNGDNVTSIYPEYDDDAGETVPTRPADYAGAVASAEWTPAGTSPSGTLAFEDVYAPRGIYYYEVFAVDAATNVGPAAAANDHATNYWLGDVRITWDGLVNTGDITDFGACFGTTHAGGAPYNNHCDVGPTDDMSRVGIPTTDDVIDFDDLMIFAMNYGNVSKFFDPAVGDMPVLAWRRLEDGALALELVEPSSSLKGLRITANLPSGSCQVSPGALLTEQDGPIFVRNIDRFGLDASAALFGSGEAVSGTGELLRVTGADGLDPAEITITARGTDNSDLMVSMAPVAGQAPAVFRADQNYPNPFNPMTTIAFDLPEARDVRLRVYAIDGSLVCTLTERHLEAGHHDFVWNGLDSKRQQVASGTYFYRLEAGRDIVTKKMVLMK